MLVKYLVVKEFKTLTNVGLRCATKDDCNDIAEGRISRSRNAARIGLRALDNIPDIGSLTSDELASTSAKRAVLSLAVAATKPSRRLCLKNGKNA